MAEIKYRFAQDEKGEIIDINDVSSQKRKDTKFFCLSCHEPMTAVIGTGKRAKHFRHQADIDCNKESYLHILAKQILKERFDNSDSFPISLYRTHHCDRINTCPNKLDNIQGCFSTQIQIFDLKNHYDQCVLELKDPKSGMKPDLTLRDSTGKQNPIWLEILVTHPCSEEKKNEGTCIIEFKIESEEDALDLRDKHISEDNGIIFYNFKKKSDSPDSTITNQYYQYRRAELLSNGYIRERKFTCRENKKNLSPDAIASVEISTRHYGSLFVYDARKIFAAYGIGNFKHCTWCKYNKTTIYENRICTCYKQLNLPKQPDCKEAYYCSLYRPQIVLECNTLIIGEGMSLEDLQTKMKDLPETPPKPIYQIPEEPINPVQEKQSSYNETGYRQIMEKVAEKYAEIQRQHDKLYSHQTQSIRHIPEPPRNCITENYLMQFCNFTPHPDHAMYCEWEKFLHLTLMEWRGEYLRKNSGKFFDENDVYEDEHIASLKNHLSQQFTNKMYGGIDEFEEWFTKAYNR